MIEKETFHICKRCNLFLMQKTVVSTNLESYTIRIIELTVDNDEKQYSVVWVNTKKNPADKKNYILDYYKSKDDHIICPICSETGSTHNAELIAIELPDTILPVLAMVWQDIQNSILGKETFDDVVRMQYGIPLETPDFRELLVEYSL